MKPSNILKLRERIRESLRWVISDVKRDLERNPEDHTEPGADAPSMDVRLCIDGERFTVRTGSVDFDPYHSEICAASCIDLETDLEELTDELISAAVDQAAERGES